MKWFKKHKILTVVGVIILLAIIGGASGGGGGGENKSNTGGSSKTENKPATTESKPAAPKIGETARDGKFEFVVKGVECGKTSVGS